MMVGRVVDTLYPKTEAKPSETVLSVRGPDPQGRAEGRLVRRATGRGAGPGGLVGAGRTEIARCIFGADRFEQGTITLDGEPVTIRSPAGRRAARHRLRPGGPQAPGPLPGDVRARQHRHERRSPDDAGRLRRPRGRDGGGRVLPRPPVRPAAPARTSPSAACPAATSRRSPWPSGWPCSPRSSSSTSPRAASTWAPRPRSMPSSTSWRTRASASSSSRRSCPRSST